MEDTQAATGRIEELRAQLQLALVQQDVDDAGRLMDELTDIDPTAKNDPLPRVFWLLQCGRPHDALYLLNDFGDDAYPELRAICLKSLGDPTWQGLAIAARETSGPVVRLAMSQLLNDTGA